MFFYVIKHIYCEFVIIFVCEKRVKRIRFSQRVENKKS